MASVFGISEQQQGKPSFSGIEDKSMYGSIDSVIQAFNMAANPLQNQIVFVSEQLGRTFVGHPVSGQNAIDSVSTYGRLSYTIHALSDILGLSFQDIMGFDKIALEVRILVPQPKFTLTLQCPKNFVQRCTVTFKRTSTPQIQYISPRVVYQGSETSIYLHSQGSDYLSSIGAKQPIVQIDNTHLDLLGRSEKKDGMVFNLGQYNELKAYITDQQPNPSSDVKVVLSSGEASHAPTMPDCLPDNTCYKAKSVPTIKSMSSHSGYSTGGKTLTITGYGFDSKIGLPSITIDGVECPILKGYTNTHIQCVVPKGDVSVIGFYQGQYGIKRKLYSKGGSSGLTYTNYKDTNLFELVDIQLYTTTENSQQISDHFLTEYEGLFVPKISGKHRFYASCDDKCQVLLSQDINPGTAQLIAEQTSYTTLRNFWANPNQISDWKDLVEGQPYYLKILHIEGSGNDHVTVGVEIEPSDPKLQINQPSTEIQILSIDQTEKGDTIKWTIANPDSNYYRLRFFNLNMQDSPLSMAGIHVDLGANFNEGQIRSALSSVLYKPIFKSDIKVTKTQVSTSPLTYEIVVTALKALEKDAIQYIAVQIPNNYTLTSATIEAVTSATNGPYFKPLSGYFQIQCYDTKLQTFFKTDPISVKENVSSVKERILQVCPEYRYKLDIFEGNKYKYIENGRQLYLYIHTNRDVPQFTIVQPEPPFRDDGDYPQVKGLDLVLGSQTQKDKGNKLFYWSIPFEMLKTFETQPQLKIEVGGLPAVCIVPNADSTDFDCSFNYFAPPQCTASLQGNLIITSCDLSDGCKIYYGELECTNVIKSNPLHGGQTTCTLSGNPAAGTNEIILKCPDGVIPTIKGNEPLNVVNIEPDCLYTLGGQTVTIFATNFPQTLNGNKVIVTFDINGSQCQITSLTKTQLTCTAPRFSVSSLKTGITICINDLCNNDHSIDFCEDVTPKVLTYFPNPVSPVLRTDMEFTLDFIPDGAFNPQDYSIYFESVNDTTYKRYPVIQNVEKLVTLNEEMVQVIEYKISIRFLGAHSGEFRVHISHKDLGTFDTSSLPLLDVNGYINNITPISGSPYGGTEITITGRPFSDNTEYGILENNVKIGNTDCLVFYSDKTTIKCKTALREPPNNSNPEGSQEVDVFLKAAEYAICNDTNNPTCHFQWTLQGLPIVESISPIWDEESQFYHISIKGSAFVKDIEKQLFIDGVNHPIEVLSDIEVSAKLIWLDITSTTNIEFFTKAGRPHQYWLLQQGFDVDPKFIGLNLNVGSQGGSLITATIRGVGVDTTNIDLQYENGSSLCDEIKIVTFETIQCKTKAIDIPDFRDVQFVKEGIKYGCKHVDITKCQYKTSTQTTPYVTSQQIVGKNIVFTGTNFPTTGNEALCSYASIYSMPAIINSESQVTCPFQYGVPHSPVNEKPQLLFKQNDSTITQWAKIDQDIPGNPNPGFAAFPLECSINGGCPLTIQGAGLTSDLRNQEHAKIKVCGQPCDFVLSLSSDSQAVCYLRSMPKTNEKPEQLTGKVIGSIQDQADKVFADNRDEDQKEAQRKMDLQSRHIEGPSVNTHIEDYNDVLNQEKAKQNAITLESQSETTNYNTDGWNSELGNCWFGLQFQQNYVGKVTQISYFISPETDLSFINGHLHFQGSNDLNSWTNIYTLGNEITWFMNNKKFDNGQEPTFKAYRFFGDAKNSYGTQLCEVEVVYDQSHQLSLGNQVSFTEDSTPQCDSISPRFGSVKGGDIITIIGSKFSTLKEDYSIYFDGIKCEAQNGPTQNEVKCVTGKRNGYMDNSYMVFRIKGKGEVVCPHIFKYVYKWSDWDTWGGDGFPMEDESLWIPKGLNLFVDIDHPPLLKEVVIEGELIFDPRGPCPDQPRTFDAHYIFTKGGLIQAGTEDAFYECKLTITLHGRRNDPEVPLYGNKVIGVRYGVLDLHGRPRYPTWVDLYETAPKGTLLIRVMGPIEWKVNDQIIIASTSYNQDEAETRTITQIDDLDSDRPVIHFDQPLEYTHYAAVETYSNGGIAEMRGEVGLLTRSIVVQGDEFSDIDENGAIITALSTGPNSSKVRLSFVEFRKMGQAYKVGRYAIHLFILGSMSESYITGNSIHHSYNRAIALHSVQDLKVDWNVAYNIKGHAIFMADGTEIHNVIDHNLVVNVIRSWSLLNTDQLPASYWIRNPDNDLTGNRAAGSDGFGFWFNLPDHPVGVLNDPYKCPNGRALGKFDDNAAHTTNIGLMQTDIMNPKQSECQELKDTNSVRADLNNFRSWKNREKGIFMNEIGDVRLNNFLAADNLLVNIEIGKTPFTQDGTAQIINAVIIGYSGNADVKTLESSAIGLITPRTENFQVNGAKFYKLDKNQMVPLQPCSMCDSEKEEFQDSGARTVSFSQLFFEGYNKLIRYIKPKKDILFDIDGTLTGLGPRTWATPVWQHNKQPECQESIVHDSLICDNTVEIRRIAFYNYQPGSLAHTNLEILKWEEYKDLPQLNYERYEDDESRYSLIAWTQFRDPEKAWAVPFVTKHSYKLHWNKGIDFTKISIDISDRWQDLDSNLLLIFNHTAVREHTQIDIMEKGTMKRIDSVQRDTLLSKPEVEWQSGDNAQYNETKIRQIHLIINGKNQTRKTITVFPHECFTNCPQPKINTGDGGEQGNCDHDLFWSNPEDWESGHVPIENEDVIIKKGCIVYFNVDSTPTLNSVTVYGTLIWLNTATDLSLTMNTRILHNRGGTIKIGQSGEPYVGKLAQIRLFGDRFSPAISYAPYIDGGNKIIGNAGLLQMFGENRQRKTRLKQIANKGDTTIFVDPGLKLRQNDQIAILTSSSDWRASEDVLIQSYNDQTGEVKLKTPLQHTHWGTANPTYQDYANVDIRAEVLLFTSNVKITAEEEVTGQGCQIVTSDYIESSGVRRIGVLEANNIEVYNCSQFDTFKAALRFDNARTNESFVHNCAFHHGRGIGLQIIYSANIKITSTIFYDFVQFGGNLQSSSNIILSGNFFANIGIREIPGGEYAKPNAGLLICIYQENDRCTDLQIQSNTIVGSFYAGYGAPAIDCGTAGWSFKYNVAHSVNGDGAIFFMDPQSTTQSTCLEVNTFYAYKNKGYGVLASAPTNEIRFKNLVLIDNRYGTGTMIGKEGNDLKISYNNIFYFGETQQKDCEYENQCLTNPATCISKAAMVLPVFLRDYSPPFPKDNSASDKIEYNAAWGGKIELSEVTFTNYPSNKTYCGGRISLFESHSSSSDYTPEVIVQNAIFKRVHSKAIGYFYDPNPSWKVIEKCGNQDCTGLKNVIVTFRELMILNTQDVIFGMNAQTPFSLVSNNKELTPFYNDLGCVYLPNMNGHICYTEDLGHLIFENLDADKWQRALSPLHITSPNLTSYHNVLNSFMDKKGNILFGQNRLGRFASTLVAPRNTHYVYNLTYTGTVPQKQRFSLRDTPSGIIVYIKYGEQNSFSVRNEDGGGIIEANGYDKSIMQQKPIHQFDICGENRYVGVDNILEFYITPGCTLVIEPRNTVLARVRLEWTLDDFFADGGTTMFIDRLSAVLGIHPSTVKMVKVQKGSVILVFEIEAIDDDPVQVAEIRNKLDQLLSQNSTLFGRPLLDHEVTSSVTVDLPTNNTLVPYSNDEEVKEDKVVGLSKQQLLIATCVGSVAIACIIFLVICITIVKRKRAIPIQVSSDSTSKQVSSKNNMVLSQEYETQYHPQLTTDRRMNKKTAVDNLADVEMQQDGLPQEDQWEDDYQKAKKKTVRYSDIQVFVYPKAQPITGRIVQDQDIYDSPEITGNYDSPGVSGNYDSPRIRDTENFDTERRFNP